MILHLAVSVEHGVVTDKQTDRQTHDYDIYHASMASHGKTQNTLKSIASLLWQCTIEARGKMGAVVMKHGVKLNVQYCWNILLSQQNVRCY